MRILALAALLLAVGAAAGCAADDEDAPRAHAPAAMTPAAAGEPCRASPTSPIPLPDGARVISTGGRPPVTNGVFEGTRAVLPIGNRIDGLHAAKLWHRVGAGGPDVVRVTARPRGGGAPATFSLGGVRPRTEVLVLRREELVRRFRQPGTGDAFAPGGMYVAAPGCYRLIYRWAGGGLAMTVRVARESGAPAEGAPAMRGRCSSSAAGVATGSSRQPSRVASCSDVSTRACDSA